MDIAEKLLTVAENEQKVAQLNNQLSECLGGGTVSENDVLDKVYEAGQQSEYDRFWDNYQQNGKRASYLGAFSGSGWNTALFKPKYDIVPTSAIDNMFYAFGGKLNDDGTKSPLDLVEYLDELGITLDFSKCTQTGYVFSYANISRVGKLDFKSIPKSSSTLNTLCVECTKLVTVEELVLYDKTLTYTNMFQNCTALTNLTISGVIANNFKLSWCTKLTHDSLMSVINHLKDFTGTSTTKTLTLGTTNLDKLTDEEKAIATDKGWTLA